MFDAQWDLKDYEKVIEKMRGLPVALRGKAGKSAAGKAMSIMRKAAIRNALALDDPLTSRQIARNIVQRPNARFMRRTGDIMIRIGVLGGARNYEAYGEITTGKDASVNPGGDTFYWRFLEFGTKKTKAQPFMRTAFDDTSVAVQDTFATEIERVIDKLAAKG